MSEDETELIYHEDHNIGVATDTPHGLLVPNIKVISFKKVVYLAAPYFFIENSRTFLRATFIF